MEVDDFPKNKNKLTGIDKCLGLIDIGHIALYKEGSKVLSQDYSQ